MTENKKVRGTKKDSEAGYGMVIVVVIIFFVCVAVFAALASSMRASRSQENLNIRDDEKWAAKSAMATMRRVLEVRIPQKHETHLTEAQNCLRSMGSPNSTLPVFDEQDAAPESSVPVLLVGTDGSTTCNQPSGFSAALSYTSLLGNTNAWAQNLLPLWEQDAYGYGYQAEMLKVARLGEQFRRFNSAGDPVYVFGFIIDARGGQHFRIRENGEVTLGNVSQNCGATGRLEITPRTVQRGNPVTFQITYTNVNRLRIFNRANVLLHEENVTEQPDPQVFSWNYTPSATDSYRVEALSNNSGCYSRSEWIEVVVTNTTPPACPVIDDLTASPDTVASGGISIIQWVTRDAAEVTLEGDIVAASDSRGYIIPAERTFTLIARDAANNCPATRQIHVRVNLASCPTPTVRQFDLNPPSATPGQPITISWQIDDVMPGGTVNITLPDGTVLSNVGASGTRTVNAPGTSGTHNYSIAALNPCGTTASAAAQLTVTNACTPVTFTSPLTANPPNVLVGGNQTVRLTWALSDVADSMNITNVGDVSGTFVDIPQPQVTTTYIHTATRCGQLVQSQTTITVGLPPVANSSTRLFKTATVEFGRAERTVYAGYRIYPDGILRAYVSINGSTSFPPNNGIFPFTPYSSTFNESNTLILSRDGRVFATRHMQNRTTDTQLLTCTNRIDLLPSQIPLGIGPIQIKVAYNGQFSTGPNSASLSSTIDSTQPNNYRGPTDTAAPVPNPSLTYVPWSCSSALPDDQFVGCTNQLEVPNADQATTYTIFPTTSTGPYVVEVFEASLTCEDGNNY